VAAQVEGPTAHGAVVTTATTAAQCCALGLRWPRTPAARPQTTGPAGLPPARSTNTNVVGASSSVNESTSPDNLDKQSAVPGSDLTSP
jgi:hypothetical protein